MHTRLLILVCIVCMAASAPAADAQIPAPPVPEAVAATRPDPVARLSDFIGELPTDPGVDREIDRFDGGGLESDYRSHFAESARERLGAEVEALLTGLLQNGCQPGVSVDFPGKSFSGQPEPRGVEEDFEDSVVLTRAVGCYGTELSPDSLLRLYSSPEVRMEAQSRLEDIVEEDGLVCYAVGGVPLLLAPTRSCNLVTRTTAANFAAEHSQSVRSSVEDHQPVYFKESLKAAVRLADGTTGLVHVTVTRSTGLGGLEKRLGRGRIEESLRRQIEVLGERVTG